MQNDAPALKETIDTGVAMYWQLAKDSVQAFGDRVANFQDKMAQKAARPAPEARAPDGEPVSGVTKSVSERKTEELSHLKAQHKEPVDKKMDGMALGNTKEVVKGICGHCKQMECGTEHQVGSQGNALAVNQELAKGVKQMAL